MSPSHGPVALLEMCLNSVELDKNKLATAHSATGRKLRRFEAPHKNKSWMITSFSRQAGWEGRGVHDIYVKPSVKGPSLFGSQVSPKYKAVV